MKIERMKNTSYNIIAYGTICCLNYFGCKSSYSTVYSSYNLG